MDVSLEKSMMNFTRQRYCYIYVLQGKNMVSLGNKRAWKENDVHRTCPVHTEECGA